MNKIVIYVFLCILLSVVALYGYFNYHCVPTWDPLTYVRFAKALAKGQLAIDCFPIELSQKEILPDNVDFGFFATDVVKDGKTFYPFAIGYPLLLAFFMRLFDDYFIWYSNVLFIICFFLIYFYLMNHIFSLHTKNSFSFAFISLLFLVIVGWEAISIQLQLFRGISSYFFLFSGILLLFKFLDSKKMFFVVFSGILIGYACAIRENNVIALPFLGIYIIFVWTKERNFRYFSSFLLFVFSFLVGLGPLLVQNHLITGNVFKLPQLEYSDTIRAGRLFLGVIPHEPFGYRNIPRTFPGIVRLITSTYGILYTSLLVLGVSCFKKERKLALLFMLGIGYVLFFSMWPYPAKRYLLIVSFFFAPVITAGFWVLLSKVLFFFNKYLPRIKLKQKESFLLLFFAFIFMVKVFIELIPCIRPQQKFQCMQAISFKQDIEGHIEPSSIILASRRLRDIIEVHTSAYTIEPKFLSRYGCSIPKAIELLMGSGKNIYFFDSKDGNPLHGYDHTPCYKESIQEYLNLTPLEQFQGSRYNLERYFGKEHCTLYRIEGWKNKAVTQHVELCFSQFQDSILQVNARQIWNSLYQRNSVRLYFNDCLLSTSITNGINYFYIPKKLFYGNQEVKMVSDAPLPNNIEPKIFSVYDSISIDVGAASVPLDTNYLSREFYEVSPETDSYSRNIIGRGKVKIPTIKYPDTTLLFLCRVIPSVGDISKEMNMTFSINGHKQATMRLLQCNEWQTVSFPLQNKDIDKAISELVLTAIVCDPGNKEYSKAKDVPACLSIDRFSIRRYDNKAEPTLINIGRRGDEFYIHSGFYKRENHLGKYPVRWTNGIAKINLPHFRRDRAKVLLEIKAWGPPPAVGERVSNVYLNGKEIAKVRIIPVLPQSFWIKVPKNSLLVGFNELKIESDAWTPSEVMGSADTRHLGIMFDSICIHYM